MNIASKLPDVGTTIFTTMSQMALDYKAINLGQGFPDFNTHPDLISLVSKAMQEGHNQYPAMAGYPALRQAISDKALSLYGHHYDPATEITVTSGATEALMSSFQAFVHPGDEVIVIEPLFDSYIPAITLAGVKVVSVPLTPPSSNCDKYTIDWNKVEAAISPRTRLIALNFPHNPTGIILSEQDLDAIERITTGTDIILLSDEVYEHIVFNGKKHLSLASRKSLAERSLVISSFGKTYHTTGWKIGYVCAPKALTTELRKVHQFAVFTVSSPMQVALAQFMQQPEHHENLSAFYQDKHDLLLAGLQQTRFRPLPSEGSFFLLADYSRISDMPEIEFSLWLTQEHGVTVIPVSAFYRDPSAPDSNHRLVRFCFAKQDHTLNAALEKLAKV